MRLITEQTRIQDALKCNTVNQTTHKTENIGDLLKAKGILPENTTRQDITDVIGMPYIGIHCSECDQEVETAVEIGVDESSWLCLDCLNKAVNLIKEAAQNAESH